jgi:Family of unknown function (DUF6220)
VNPLRTIYRFWSVVVFLAILAQIGAAGYGAFYVTKRLDDKGESLDHAGFKHGWDFHSSFGYLTVLAMLILLALALLARLGRPRIWWPLALAVAGVVQVFLAGLGTAVPGLGFLHPLNALVIFTLSGLIVHRSWRKVRAIG